ncbi:MAG TPA: hypothetical protein PLH11_00950 [Gemmobacter sp.]|nr:hypothetical protein [Gemmobacter sp.]
MTITFTSNCNDSLLQASKLQTMKTLQTWLLRQQKLAMRQSLQKFASHPTSILQIFQPVSAA